MKEKLVKKLFHNTCTEEELEILFELIKQDPSPPDTKLADKLWKEVQGYPKLKKAVFNRIFSKILSKIDANEKTVTQTATTQVKPASLRRPKQLLSIAGIAASIIFLIAASTLLFNYGNESTVIQTAFGERQILELSDGSKVQLNANSQMTFDPKWAEENNREVRLEGEAFFEVKKKPLTTQKFQVITHDLIIEVLGTTFNVNSTDGKTSVYLEEGQIRLYLNTLDSIILMKPGDLVVYSEQTGELFKKCKEIAELHTSWKDGVLTFKDAPLREVLHKIETIYGVEFTVVNEKDFSRVINFPLPFQELETAISILDKTMIGLEIQKEGNTYVIK